MRSEYNNIGEIPIDYENSIEDSALEVVSSDVTDEAYVQKPYNEFELKYLGYADANSREYRLKNKKENKN